MTSTEDCLKEIPPGERILLLPHCLRRAATCQGTYDNRGLHCRECNPDCPVYHLTRAAARYGYKGICVAPGGRLAVNYVKETAPQAVVAVACEKELEEGIQGVRELATGEDTAPVIVVIPLTRDGCIDTEVDIDRALVVISLGRPLGDS